MVTPRQRLGSFGERLAAHHLEAAGYTILARNLRIGRHEIDLLARDGTTLVFVEVRTRRGSAGLAAESLEATKLQRLAAAAFTYCQREGIDPDTTRLDALTIDLDRAGRTRAIHHYRGIEPPPL